MKRCLANTSDAAVGAPRLFACEVCPQLAPMPSMAMGAHYHSDRLPHAAADCRDEELDDGAGGGGMDMEAAAAPAPAAAPGGAAGD